MLVDFHVHSSASDGTFTPSEIAAKAMHDEFTAIALTDHDNCDGVEEFIAGTGSRRIVGIELSIEPGAGFDKFHLIGLGIRHDYPQLKSFLARVLDGRNARNERILANFRRIGIEMGEEIFSYAHGDVLARPHFARWLMEHGYAKTIVDAFDKYLLPDSPAQTRCYEERYHPSQTETIELIHAAGGVAIMAHPKYWRKYWRDSGVEYEAAERGLAELKEKGLDGVEALYQANTVDENIAFTRMTDRLGLLKSAGSDFHGMNKPTISLGMEVTEKFIAPLLERL